MKKKLPKGWRYKKITTVDGESIQLVTTDMRTREGKRILAKAKQIMSQS